MKDQFLEKDQMMVAYRKKFEVETRRLLEAERKNENLSVTN